MLSNAFFFKVKIHLKNFIYYNTTLFNFSTLYALLYFYMYFYFLNWLNYNK